MPDALFEAGRVARRLKEEAYRLARPGASIYELAERIESIILDNHARPAFPCNVGINQVAAHYTPTPGDVTRIPPRSVVKVDIGVEINGFIADTAVTVADTPEGEAMRLAAEEALKTAIKLVRDGARVSDIGSAIQSVGNRRGFKTIRNLTGHEISRYNLHAGQSIPNVQTTDSGRLRKGHTYAIEPFVTLPEGAGEVVESGEATIFRFEPRPRLEKGLKGDEVSLLRYIADEFRSLPYSTRWLLRLGREKLELHEKLVRNGRIHAYPVLVERHGTPVAQAEHTVLVKEDGAEVLT